MTPTMHTTHTTLYLVLAMTLFGSGCGQRALPNDIAPLREDAGFRDIDPSQETLSRDSPAGSIKVGEPCYLKLPEDEADRRGTQINTESEGCQSHLCLYRDEGMGHPEPLCTKTCSQDKDCASITRAHCAEGFRCIRPFVLGKDLACCGFCVCGSFTTGDSPSRVKTCKSVPPNCP